MVAAGLRRVVGRAGRVRRRLGERLGRVEGEIAVDLARRDVVEAVEASTPTRRTASHSVCVPTTLVRKNTPGFVIA